MSIPIIAVLNCEYNSKRSANNVLDDETDSIYLSSVSGIDFISTVETWSTNWVDLVPAIIYLLINALLIKNKVGSSDSRINCCNVLIFCVNQEVRYLLIQSALLFYKISK